MSGVLVGFAGMTHLGVNSAAAALARGFRVVGYDPDREVIEALRRGDPPAVEPGLPDVLRRHASRANYTADIADLSVGSPLSRADTPRGWPSTRLAQTPSGT